MSEIEKREALIKELIKKIQNTSKDVHDTGTGILNLGHQQLQDLLQTLVFADPAILDTAKNAGLVIPDVPALLNIGINGGRPQVEFMPGHGNQPNQVRFVADHPTFALAIKDAKPKDFPVEKFGIRMANYLEPGKNVEGQIALAGLSLDGTIPISDIPGIGILEPVVKALKLDTKGLLKWALGDPDQVNVLSTVFYNRFIPVIAANDPDHRPSTVKGMKTEIGTNNLSMLFYRDTFTPLPSRKFALVLPVIEQMNGFSSPRK